MILNFQKRELAHIYIFISFVQIFYEGLAGDKNRKLGVGEAWHAHGAKVRITFDLSLPLERDCCVFELEVLPLEGGEMRTGVVSLGGPTVVSKNPGLVTWCDVFEVWTTAGSLDPVGATAAVDCEVT